MQCIFRDGTYFFPSASWEKLDIGFTEQILGLCARERGEGRDRLVLRSEDPPAHPLGQVNRGGRACCWVYGTSRERSSRTLSCVSHVWVRFSGCSRGGSHGLAHRQCRRSSWLLSVAGALGGSALVVFTLHCIYRGDIGA